MVRTIIKSATKSISIEVPADYVGKEVEVIAFTIEETRPEDATDIILTHFASEKALAKDWLSPEEDIAWQSL
ncbi:DUF2281 domain-containing protein [Mucilaginibacter psychrotolerans]|uniref:DUF2281 domain-containing protein n=1 Tax=Mucilaginibacter psychrotolerans TaxID=1524096 RepID=A0A4Y8RXP3_9SPHI|nr:DUF2281 domain-containing protein [Mucilaginibacter psychrotolerans]TFF30427.1 DUF2281 domain-containing protein [Mucilaginibacter psychrotolerans]